MADDAYKLDVDFSSLDKAVAEAIDTFGGLTVKVIEGTNTMSDAFVNVLQKGMVSTFESGSAAAETAFSVISTAASGTWAAMTGGASLVVGGISATFGVLTSTVSSAFAGITGVASVTWGAVSGSFTKAFNKMAEENISFGLAWRKLTGAAGAIWDKFMAYFEGDSALDLFFNKIAKTFQPVVEKLAYGVDLLFATFKALEEVVFNSAASFTNFAEGAKTGSGEAQDAISSMLGITEKDMRDWANAVMKFMHDAFDFIVDAGVRGFTLIETAIQDFPGFMQKASAKFKLYWEETTQFIARIWDRIAAEIEHIWSKTIASLQNTWMSWVNSIASSSIFTKAFSKLYGISEEDFKKSLGEMQQAQQSFVAGPRRATRGQTDEEKKRLEELRKAADAAGGAFNEKFAANLSKNQAAVDAFKQRVLQLVGSGLTGEQAQNKAAMEQLGEASKEAGKGGKEKTSAGAFEDLLSLQKRISGAASVTNPVDAATISIPKKLDEQNKKLDQQGELAKQEFSIAQQMLQVNKNIEKKQIGHAIAAD